MLFNRVLVPVLVSLFLFASCTSKTAQPPAQPAAAGAGAGGASSSRVVNLAIWSNYVSPELLAEFEKKTGIKVQISNYSSNEELVAKLQAGASGYDVAVPTDYMVFAMIKLGLIQPLDFSQLPNFKHVDPQFLKKNYDPENKFSVPYDWGTTGIAVNRTLYKGQIKGWKDLFNNPELAGKFTLLDDVRETIGAALKAQGYSLNSKNPEELKKAKELLFKVRGKVKGFTSEPMMPLVNGETAVAHAYLGDALQARRQTGGKIEYIIPEEGGTFYIDTLVVPKGATHVKEAHEFINFLLLPESNVATVKAVMVAPANKDTRALLPPELKNDPSLFPSPAVMSKREMMEDLGDATALWDRIWTEVKASRE